MKKILITNATLVNEGKQFASDLLVKDGRIEQISSQISADAQTEVIDAEGKYLIPGMIDDQVHFREPGLTHKGNIASESAAAVAGGITTFMEMPNVNPQTTTNEALEAKYALAQKSAQANFSFYLGATNDNIEVIKALDPNLACGVKVFMGASTGNMLVNDEKALADIFSYAPTLIATHCEDSPTITANEQRFKAQYGEAVPFNQHGNIRSEEACYLSSSMAVGLAKKHGARLHVLHLTTAKEMELFTPTSDICTLKDANISAEVCVHHLFFNDQDYDQLGSLIKCNPAVKTRQDQIALIKAVNDDVIDIIATDHAPHTWEEKQNSYFNAPSGLPLVQHALLSLLELHHQGHFSLETIVKKTSHAVAERFQLKERGYLREGYFADVVLVDPKTAYNVNKDNILYHCGWSPFEGISFQHSIDTTLVNGQIVYRNNTLTGAHAGTRVQFNR